MAEMEDEMKVIRLNKATTFHEIATWNGYANIMMIVEWLERKNETFDEEYFKALQSTQLRFHIIEIQQELDHDDNILVSRFQ